MGPWPQWSPEAPAYKTSGAVLWACAPVSGAWCVSGVCVCVCVCVLQFWHVHALPCTALHCPAPSCTALQDSCTTVNHSICRPLGGTMMAHGRAFSAT